MGSVDFIAAVRKRLPETLFVAAVLSITVVWALYAPWPAALFAGGYGLALLLAKFAVRSEGRRYLCGAAALGLLAAGQTLFPLSYYDFPHVAFNTPFVTAYLFPRVWPGAVIGGLMSYLFYSAALAEGVALALYKGPLVGMVVVSFLCHGLSYLLQKLIKERNDYRELSARLRAEIEQEYLEKEKVKEKLYRLDRLNLVGEMAASIGHEVRNPLTTVRGYLQFFEGKGGFAQYKEALRLMIEELDRANAIITEFLSLAKNKRMDLKPANLNDVLRAIQPMLGADAIRCGHELVFELGDAPDIVMDENEIRQMVMNLVRNGIEAMDAPGRLTVRTAAPASSVLLTVSDSGPGIPPEVAENLGKPFFTTKDKGTGLGLAVCYRIAERHQALMSFDSSPRGTTVTVRFGAGGLFTQ